MAGVVCFEVGRSVREGLAEASGGGEVSPILVEEASDAVVAGLAEAFPQIVARVVAAAGQSGARAGAAARASQAPAVTAGLKPANFGTEPVPGDPDPNGHLERDVQAAVIGMNGGRAVSRTDVLRVIDEYEGYAGMPKAPSAQAEFLAGVLLNGGEPVRVRGGGPWLSKAPAEAGARSWPVSDFQDRLAGVSFRDPDSIKLESALFNDGDGVLGFTSARDHIIVMNPGQSDSHGALRSNSFIRRTAPWAEKNTFFVIAESSSGGRQFTVSTPDGGQENINATSLGRAVAESAEFRQHAGRGRGPDITVVLLADGATASAGEFRDALASRADIRPTVYAYSGSASALVAHDRTARVPVAVTASDHGHWTVFASGDNDPAARYSPPGKLVSETPWEIPEIHAPGYANAVINQRGEAAPAQGERLRLIGLQDNATVTLADGNGSLIGVSIGAFNERSLAVSWAQNNGPAKHYSFKDELGDEMPDSQEVSIPSPWLGLTGERPFYIVGHGSGVAREGGGISSVRGSAMALAVMRTKEFRRIHQSGETYPTSYVLVACSMARGKGPRSPADDFQRTLDYYGFSAPVVAATGIVETHADGATGTEEGHRWVSFGRPGAGRGLVARPAAVGPGRPVVVQFPEQARELDNDVLAPVRDQLDRLARSLADTGAERRQSRLPIPTAHITGYGNGRTLRQTGAASGLKRARSVQVYLQGRILDYVLGQNARWRLAARLDTEDAARRFAVELVPQHAVHGEPGRGRGGPGEGRQVIISVQPDHASAGIRQAHGSGGPQRASSTRPAVPIFPARVPGVPETTRQVLTRQRQDALNAGNWATAARVQQMLDRLDSLPTMPGRPPEPVRTAHSVSEDPPGGGQPEEDAPGGPDDGMSPVPSDMGADREDGNAVVARPGEETRERLQTDRGYDMAELIRDTDLTAKLEQLEHDLRASKPGAGQGMREAGRLLATRIKELIPAEQLRGERLVIRLPADGGTAAARLGPVMAQLVADALSKRVTIYFGGMASFINICPRTGQT